MVVSLQANNTTTKHLNKTNMKTAVEWLIEQLHSGKELSTVIHHAKAMEKVQIINAYWDAYNEGKYSGDKTADEYYKETFKQE